MHRTLIDLAVEFYERNTELVDGIVEQIKAAGADETALDELITEGAENSGFDEDIASELNNQGLTYQVASILEGNGVNTGRSLIAEAVSGATPTFTL